MRFNARVNRIQFDKKAYLRRLDDHMTETTKESARSWLRTVLVIIPTWSRASRATFAELANAVGFHITYGPIRSREDRLILGLQTGRGGLKTTTSTWHFFYETDLRYLAYNEANRVVFGQAPNVFSRSGLTNPTPYNFQEAGRADFESFAREVKLPNPFDFVRGKRLA